MGKVINRFAIHPSHARLTLQFYLKASFHWLNVIHIFKTSWPTSLDPKLLLPFYILSLIPSLFSYNLVGSIGYFFAFYKGRNWTSIKSPVWLCFSLWTAAKQGLAFSCSAFQSGTLSTILGHPWLLLSSVQNLWDILELVKIPLKSGSLIKAL